MPDPGSAHPALSDAALRETLDLLGTVVANMAGKLDRHGQILADVQKAASESRDAAHAAKTFADPQRYGRHIGQELDKALNATLDRLKALQSGLATDRQETRRSLEELVRQEEAVLHHLRDDLEKAERWKKRIPFIALLGLVLALGLTIALPRFLAGNSIGCAALGGEWLKESQSGRLACVFYEE
jgi:ABC-type transporter Mla subunit MlaD